MATRAAVQITRDDGMVDVSWSGLLNGDDGAGVAVGRFADKTVQVTGTPGVGLNAHIEGSNDGGVTYGRLNDPQGTPINIVDTAPVVIAESPLLIRPKIAAGDGTTNVVARIAAVLKGL